MLLANTAKNLPHTIFRMKLNYTICTKLFIAFFRILYNFLVKDTSVDPSPPCINTFSPNLVLRNGVNKKMID